MQISEKRCQNVREVEHVGVVINSGGKVNEGIRNRVYKAIRACCTINNTLLETKGLSEVTKEQLIKLSTRQ